MTQNDSLQETVILAKMFRVTLNGRSRVVKMKEERQLERTKIARKPYEPPKLVIHGSVRKVTAGSKQNNNDSKTGQKQ